MISVSISINGEAIFARSARNQSTTDDNGKTQYITDAGDVIYHDRDKGAVDLAIEMLKTIKENMDKPNKQGGKNDKRRTKKENSKR